MRPWEQDWRERYVAALYWSVMTICTVGYGDIVPVTLAERCFLIFAMLLGASLYAYVVGSVCGRGLLTLVHFSAQRKRFLWDRGCV